MMLSHWPWFTWKFFMILFPKILKLVFQKQHYFLKIYVLNTYFHSFLGNVLIPQEQTFYRTCVKRFVNVLFIFSKVKSSVPSNITPLYFFSSKLRTLFKKSPLKCKCLRFLSAWVKIYQIFHVSFETKSPFLFKFCIIIQC